jgi:hypothetical protein
MKFELQNESSGDAAAVYSSASANPLAKVVPDAQLQALLDSVSRPRACSPRPSRRCRPMRATSDGRPARAPLDLGAPPARGAGCRGRFPRGQGLLPRALQQRDRWHRGSGERPDLLSEQSRVKADADAAKKKLENLGRKQ